MDYTFELPTRITIGEGCSSQLGANVASAGAKRVMCIFDKGVEAAGIVEPLVASLETAGVEVVRFDGVLPDPPMEVIEQCSRIANDVNPDAFVAVGGAALSIQPRRSMQTARTPGH